jgi:hypothetical protein
VYKKREREREGEGERIRPTLLLILACTSCATCATRVFQRAHSGDMGSIPSMWELVLERTVSGAKTAAEQVHREMILDIHAKRPPVTPESWDLQSGAATRAALKTFRRAVKDFQHHKIDSTQRELSKQLAHETQRELQVRHEEIKKQLQRISRSQTEIVEVATTHLHGAIKYLLVNITRTII